MLSVDLTEQELTLIAEELSSRIVCNVDAMWSYAAEGEASVYRHEDYVACAIDNAKAVALMIKLGLDVTKETGERMG